jgi:protein CpxP
MFHVIDRPSRVLAATALFGALILAAPTHAQTSASTPTQTTQSKSTAKSKAPVDRVEARIAELHAKLKITPDQEAKWTDVVQVMRDNAKRMDSLLQARSQNLRTMTAVDDLKSYQEITDAHSQGLQKLIPAFQSLYDTMGTDQKKNADKVFAQFQGPSRTSQGPVAKGS